METADKQVTSRVLPWMRAGTDLTVIEGHMSAEEAAAAGGLDFTVSTRDLAFAPEGAHDGTVWTEAPHRKMVVADDNEQPFDVVSADYKTVQYSRAFDFLNVVDARYVASGTLMKRRQGFIVAQMDGLEHLTLAGDDPHDMFLVCRTSHDRTRKLEIAAMAIRGRCMNQLALASFTKGATHRVTMPHVGDVELKAEEVKAKLSNFRAYVHELEEMSQRLNKIVLEEAQAEKILKIVLKAKPKTQDKLNIIVDLWKNSETVGYPTTAWGLVNAVSEYYDWYRALGTPESRLLGALQGQTYNAVNRTAQLAIRLG